MYEERREEKTERRSQQMGGGPTDKQAGEQAGETDGRADRKAPVIAAECPDYEEGHVKEAVQKVLAGWDGLKKIGEGTKVAIKVNLVSAKAPNAAATTHPALVTELCRQLTARGAKVVVGDSPGGLFTKEALEHVYKVSGMTQVESVGAQLNYDTSTEDVHFDAAVSARVFTCTSWLRKADVIINFTKLKTHGMVRLTASVKNMFGSVPGTTKPEYHMRFPDTDAFCNMLIDLNEFFRPSFNMIDAVTCMEGNGPTAGTPRHMGLLLGSKSPYDLDMVCADLMTLGLEDVPTLLNAKERGLGPASMAEVEVIGADIKKYRDPDFKAAAGKSVNFTTGNGALGKLASSVMMKALQQVPKVRPSECISCGKCFRVCPAKAISMKADRRAKGGKAPHIDRSKCIRCFCCQEFCPVGAMKVHRTAIAKLLQKKSEGSGQ